MGSNQRVHIVWRLLIISGIALVAAFLTGCASAEKEVQRAAKDWCMTLRGSQVIPVYPLTEDLQPGDVFLVQVPIDRQQEIYKEKGFLPLDNHLARLDPSGYEDFYSHSFLTNGSNVVNILPRDWIRPHGVGMYFGTNESNTHSWLAAPRASFPTYNFSVRNGAGLNLAVPIQGVPVALGLLASDAANGSVQIQEGRTLGVDLLSIYHQVRQWAAANAGFLQQFGRGISEDNPNFLRVVTRVYATGRMMVTLRDAKSRSGGLDAGAPKPVNLLVPEAPNFGTSTAEAVQNYTNAWNALSEMVKAASTAKDVAGNILPGGSLRLAAASTRSVSLDETFDPPLVVGYLGFDCAIFKGGLLGPPVPTHAVLDPEFNLGGLLRSNPVYAQMVDKAVYNIIQSENTTRGTEVKNQLDALENFVPHSFTEFSTEQISPERQIVAKKLDSTVLHNPGFPGYLSYHGFRGRLDTSINALEAALAEPAFSFKDAEGQTMLVQRDSPLRRELEMALTNAKTLRDHLQNDAQVQSAFADAYGLFLEKLVY